MRRSPIVAVLAALVLSGCSGPGPGSDEPVNHPENATPRDDPGIIAPPMDDPPTEHRRWDAYGDGSCEHPEGRRDGTPPTNGTEHYPPLLWVGPIDCPPIFPSHGPASGPRLEIGETETFSPFVTGTWTGMVTLSLGDLELDVAAHQDCARARLWVETEVGLVEALSSYNGNASCADVDKAKVLTGDWYSWSFTMLPKQIIEKGWAEPDKSYSLVAAFDAESTSWNVTASAEIMFVADEDRPRWQFVMNETYAAGAPIRFATRVENSYPASFNYTTPTSCDVPPTVTLTTPTGNAFEVELVMYRTGAGCYQAFWRQSLPPDAARERAFAWDGRINRSPAPPGVYALEVRWNVMAPSWDTSNTGTLVLV